MEQKLSRDRRIAEYIGKAMAEARLRKGITQVSMSKHLSMAVNSYRRYESGAMAIRSNELFKFAQATECSIAELFPKVGSDF